MIDVDPPHAGPQGDPVASGIARESEDNVSQNGADVRGRSTIAFPYGSLKDAERIAEELKSKWGDSASPDQLAGGLGQQPRSGAFRMKVATARTFGVVRVSRGNISLTPLGQRIIDPKTRANARIEAFKEVQLFSALLDTYRGSLLPPDAGLEQKIGDLGVSAKQTAKARQAFQRSAEMAGFFKHGRERLVEPATNLPDADTDPNLADEDESKSGNGASTSVATAELPAPLPELWLTLLRDGGTWSPDKTQEFVDTARKLHELLAKPD